jgi:hypothetical protein
MLTVNHWKTGFLGFLGFLQILEPKGGSNIRKHTAAPLQLRQRQHSSPESICPVGQIGTAFFKLSSLLKDYTSDHFQTFWCGTLSILAFSCKIPHGFFERSPAKSWVVTILSCLAWFFHVFAICALIWRIGFGCCSGQWSWSLRKITMSDTSYPTRSLTLSRLHRFHGNLGTRSMTSAQKYPEGEPRRERQAPSSSHHTMKQHIAHTAWSTSRSQRISFRYISILLHCSLCVHFGRQRLFAEKTGNNCKKPRFTARSSGNLVQLMAKNCDPEMLNQFKYQPFLCRSSMCIKHTHN